MAMGHLTSLILLMALAGHTSAATVKSTRSGQPAGCGKDCKSYREDSALMSRCLRYACRKHVFRYYMRVGKREGYNNPSVYPAFRHRLLLKTPVEQQQRQLQHLLQQQQQQREQKQQQQLQQQQQRQQMQPRYQQRQQDLDEDQRSASERPEHQMTNYRDSSIYPPRRDRSSFHARNLNNLYRYTNSPTPSKLLHRVAMVPMTSAQRRANDRQRVMRIRRRMPLLFPRLNFILHKVK